MKHADTSALAALCDVIENLRRRSILVEKPLGIFHNKGQTFLHFHKEPTGLFADLRHGEDWQRFPVNDPEECADLLAAVDLALAEASRRRI